MKHHHCAEKPEKPVKTKQQRKRNPKKDTTNATTESDANGEKTEAVSASADKKSDANKMHPCHLCTVGHFFTKFRKTKFEFLYFLISRSAHRTPNFMNPEFQFPQFKVLQSVFFSF